MSNEVSGAEPAALAALEKLRLGLQLIADRKMFCTWRLEPNPNKPEKPRKVPYVRGGKKLAGTFADPELLPRLMTLGEAISAFQRNGHNGAGIVFTPGCGVIGIDFDDCLDMNKKLAATSAQKSALSKVRRRAFIERSQSGTGFHAIMLGDASTAKANGELEVFGDRNFLALTGAAGQGVAQAIDADCTSALLQLVADIKSQKKETVSATSVMRHAPAGSVNTDLTAHLQSPDGKESIERVGDALRFVDPELKRPEWLKILWAVFHALGDAPEARELVVTWASGAMHGKQVASFMGEQDVVAAFCDYDSSRDGGIHAGTLYHYAKLGGWKDQFNSRTAEHDVGNITPGDIANGKLFAKQLAGKLVLNSTRNQWLHYSEGVWLQCERGEEVAAAKGVADRLLRSVFAYKQRPDASEDKAKKWLANAMRIQGQRGLQAMVELSKSEPGMSEPQSAFDVDPWLLCARNGVLDLKTRRLLPHDPMHLVTRRVDAEYQPDAKCPLFDKFISEIFVGDAPTVQAVQRFLGYSLTGAVSEEKFAFAYGSGANGKSVLANVLTAIMGTYCMTAPASMLEVQSNNGGARPDLARLAGARLVLANETNEGKPWDSQVIKQVVSTERIATRFLYGDVFEFQPTAKVIIRGNHKPTVHDSGDGMWRRLDLWPFERQFAEHERDMQMIDKLLAERDGILRWLVDGCMQWQRSGLLQSQKIRDASLSYRSDCDVVGQWIDECCMLSAAFNMESSALFTSYRLWSEGCGLHPMAKQALGRKLSARGIQSIATNGVRRYVGIQIRKRGVT